MQSTQSLFSGYELKAVKTRRTRRGDLMQEFMDNINPSRAASGYPPLGFASLSRFFAMRKMDEDAMYCFLQDCRRAKNFSQYFWWAMAESKRMQEKHTQDDRTMASRAQIIG